MGDFVMLSKENTTIYMYIFFGAFITIVHCEIPEFVGVLFCKLSTVFFVCIGTFCVW